MPESAPTADRCARRASGAGVLGGLVASVPVLGPALVTLCGACAGAATAAGVGFGLARWPFVAVGAAMLVPSAWRRARGQLTARGRLASATRTLLVAGAAALVTFLLVNLALVPMMKIAGQELARAFAH